MEESTVPEPNVDPQTRAAGRRLARVLRAVGAVQVLVLGLMLPHGLGFLYPPPSDDIDCGVAGGGVFVLWFVAAVFAIQGVFVCSAAWHFGRSEFEDGLSTLAGTGWVDLVFGAIVLLTLGALS